MKDQMLKSSSLDEELTFSKDALVELKMREKSMGEEKKKAMELFLQ